ncbi:MAG: GTPase Era [Chloroflexi bacterium]|nr:GTPase Era [Chloroflexota bacterium]
MPKSSVPFRAGFISVMGRTNVGKSTLINALLGQKIAAVSPRPQTTRKQQLGILTTDDSQLVFVDTPGLHQPHHKLGEYMNKEAADALEDADLILFVVDITQRPPHEEDHILVDLLEKLDTSPKVILAINKVDRVSKDEISERTSEYQALVPDALAIPISASRGDGLDTLLQEFRQQIPEGTPFYPSDTVTNLYEREIAADLIRATALVHLQNEVPHAIAIRIDEYTERGERGAYIRATLIVERESQKGIVIGEKGRMIKRIGTHARSQIEHMSGRKVYLQLRVKVRKNWRNNEGALRQFGFQR